MSKSGSSSGTKSKKAPKPAGDGGTASSKETTSAKPSETAKPDTSPKADAGAKSESGTKPESGGGEVAKSARESIGGAAGVHYGYFSSVRTPAYRSGWDDIWGKGNGEKKTATRSKRAPRKKPAPVTLGLDIDDLPSELRDGLAEVARAALKKRRLSYDKHARAGAVDWRIEVRIDR